MSAKQKAKLIAQMRYQNDGPAMQNSLAFAFQDILKKKLVQEVTRKNPDKLYAQVKSKVGGNMRSIMKSQMRSA